MPWQPPHYPNLQSRSRRYVWRALALLALVGVAIISDSCGSVEKDYKYFHWFVDGIPKPGSEEGGAGQGNISPYVAGSGQPIPQLVTYYSHKPWADENCHACHQGVSQFSMPSRDDSQICLPCHEKVTDEYRYMHGAVVSVACLWCHAPHLSRFKHLLRAKPTEICLQCHSTEDGSFLLEKEHSDITRNCLDCHFGHGSEKPGFLRPPPTPADNPDATGSPSSPSSSTGAPDDEGKTASSESAGAGVDDSAFVNSESDSSSVVKSDSIIKENH